MKVELRRSCLDLVLLGMLFEEPMHAYRLQKLIRLRGMDNVVAVRHKASIYQALERLCRLGLIEIQEMVGKETHKDGSVYAVTDRGREVAVAWLPMVLATVGAGFPEFHAAAPVLTVLAPEDAKKQFEIRAEAVGKEIIRLDAERPETKNWPHVVLFEYRKALLAAEHAWVRAIIANLSSGLYAWGSRVSK